LGDGEQTRDFTYISDIVQANLLAVRATDGNDQRESPRDGRMYNIGGGSRVTINATLEILSELIGKHARVEYKPRAAGDHRHGAADISRGRRELNYQPQVKLEEGLRRQAEWQNALVR